MDAYTPERLLNRLRELPAADIYWVAYSGGLDSHVLLYSLARLAPRHGLTVRAVHVDHGLHPDSARWARRCRDHAERLGVPIEVHRVEVRTAGAGLEAAARAARHGVFERLLGPGEALLTAHHQDDQAETVLLRLLRGAGVEGLAGMAPARTCGRGMLLRPLLGNSRRALHDYAHQQDLQWLEDPSNLSEAFDRNYLRRQVLPLLEGRWPAARAKLAAAAEHAGGAAELLGEVAESDLGEDWQSPRLAVSRLQTLSPMRRRNALRHWLREHGVRPPERRRLEQGLADLLSAGEDRQPALAWSDATLRRYRDHLYLLPAVLPAPPAAPVGWAGGEPLELPGLGRLELRPAAEGLDAKRIQQGELTVRFRQGGERCRPAGQTQSRELKKLFQEAGVPPWERERVPLLYVDGVLAAVVGFWICDDFAAAGGAALTPQWQPAWGLSARLLRC